VLAVGGAAQIALGRETPATKVVQIADDRWRRRRFFGRGHGETLIAHGSLGRTDEVRTPVSPSRARLHGAFLQMATGDDEQTRPVAKPDLTRLAGA